jgi:CheY-like chemotaxis protein
VLTNLIGNAVKFTHNGSVEVDVTAEDTDDGECKLHVAITDTGIGVLPEHRDQLFQSFEQGDSSMTRRYGGTGLGLAISKELVDLMGGTIGFDSEPAHGSKFWFTVVLEKSVARAPQALAACEQAGGEQLHGRILLADDNPVNCRVAEAMLTRCGHLLDIVHNGRAAVDAVQNKPYDIVLMDVQMPEVDGFEATRRIRHLNGQFARLPIIAMTAHAMAGDRERCLAAGMDDYITKPVQREMLQETVARWLANRDLDRLCESIGQNSAVDSVTCRTPSVVTQFPRSARG